MLDSRILEVGIGLVTVYIFMSLIVTQVAELVASALASRAVHLSKALDTLLDPKLNQALQDSPLIKSLGVKRWLGRADRKPSYIPSIALARALVEDLPETKDWKTWLDKVPEELRKPLTNLVGGAVTTVDEARDRLKAWFDMAMERVSASYKRHTQLVGMLVGLVLAAVLNADTVGLARRLWADPALRKAAAEVAETQFRACEADPHGEVCQGNLGAVRADLPLGWDMVDVQHLGCAGWASKLLGLLLTAFAASLGAPFWFDLLKRVRKPGTT